MKTIKFIKQSAAALMIAALHFTGCASAPNTMTLTTAVNGEVKLGLADTGTAVIDWDDGEIPETVTLSTPDKNNGQLIWYPHTFSGTTNRTIVIKGQNITHLCCNGYDFRLTVLDVSRFPFPSNVQTIVTC